MFNRCRSFTQRKRLMELALFWLPIIGGILLGSIAGNAWYGGNKSLGLWLAFAGLNCFLLLGVIQLQQAISKSQTQENSSTSDVDVKRFRAYVSPVEADISDATGEIPPTMTVVIKNIGQTPAYDLTWRGGFLIRDAHVKGELPLDRTTPATPVTLPPGGTLFYRSTFENWKPEFGNMITKGDARIFAIGEINYKDAFGNVRFTKYRLIGGGNPRPGSGEVVGKFVAAPEGNEQN
jgi:hypothetical protein